MPKEPPESTSVFSFGSGSRSESSSSTAKGTGGGGPAGAGAFAAGLGEAALGAGAGAGGFPAVPGAGGEWWALYYPGRTTGSLNTEEDMKVRVRILSDHAAAMKKKTP